MTSPPTTRGAPSCAGFRPLLHLGAALLLLGGWGAAWLNAEHAVVRTESAALDHFLYAAAMLLPTLAAPVASIGFRRRRTRWIAGAAGTLLLSPVILVSSFLALFATVDGVEIAEGRRGAVLVPLHRLPVDDGRSELVVYRTNCGATCSYGVVARHERRIVPGVRLVRKVATVYPAYEVQARASALAARVDGEAVRLRRWVWFGRRGEEPRRGGEGRAEPGRLRTRRRAPGR